MNQFKAVCAENGRLVTYDESFIYPYKVDYHDRIYLSFFIGVDMIAD